MIGEAVAARKPVYTLSAGITGDRHYREILDKLERSGRIARVELGGERLPELPPPEWFRIPEEEYRLRLARRLAAWLHRNGVTTKGTSE